MVREADGDLADLGHRLASGEGSEGAPNDLRRELALWEDAARIECLTGELSAVDLMVYPFLALFLRLAGRKSRQGRRHRSASFRLDRSHAEAYHC
jgi:hypothetical protein